MAAVVVGNHIKAKHFRDKTTGSVHPTRGESTAKLETILHTQLLFATFKQQIDACYCCVVELSRNVEFILIGWLFVRSIKVEEKVSLPPALAAVKKAGEEEESHLRGCLYMSNCKSSVALVSDFYLHYSALVYYVWPKYRNCISKFC